MHGTKRKFGLPPPKAKGRAGRVGYAQRLAAQEERAGGDSDVGVGVLEGMAYCSLTTKLVTDVAWGDLSASKAQAYAAADVESGANTNAIIKLSQVGTCGKQSGHIWRDIKQQIVWPSYISKAVVDVKLTMVDKAKRISQGTVGCLYPHTLLAILFHQFRTVFTDKLLGGDESDVPHFWNQMDMHPAYRRHPMHKHVRSFKKLAIPIGIHGDGTVSTGFGKRWGDYYR